MNTTTKSTSKTLTPIYNNLFEVELRSHGSDLTMLTNMVVDYDLKSSEKKVFITFDAVEESLDILIESLKQVDNVRILITDIHGSVIMSIKMDVKYIGLELKQSYSGDGLLKIGTSFEIYNPMIKVANKEDDE